MKSKLIVSTILIGTLASCSDFLTYDEISDYTLENTYGVHDRAVQTATHVYSYLADDFQMQGDVAMRAAGCDETEYVWPNSNVHTFYDGTWSALKPVDDVWEHYYAGIRAANDFLENGVGRTFDELKYDEDYEKMMQKYNNLQWEVRFLRAYYYFELAKRYENIPLITRVLTNQEANQVEQSPFDDIVRFIVEECDTTMKMLPRSYTSDYDSETGRATKAAPMALKARVLLYAASKLHNPDQHHQKWVDAALASKMLIDSASAFGFSTLPPFSSVVSQDNYSCSELILGARRSASNTLEVNNFPIGFEGGNTGNCPTRNLVDCYGMRRGRTFDPENPYQDRDPRLDYTVVTNGSVFCYKQTVDISEGSPNGLPTNGATKTGYYMKKFVNGNISLTNISTTTARHTFPIFRFAEVYLNYAEAMTEAYGFNTKGDRKELDMTAFQAVTKVRSRGGLALPALTAADYASNAEFMTAIRRERMAELAFEDHRFWDIRRWMIGPETTVIKRTRIVKDPATGKYAYSDYETNDRLWEDRMYLYPIPTTELNKNPKLKQNPGW